MFEANVSFYYPLLCAAFRQRDPIRQSGLMNPPQTEDRLAIRRRSQYGITSDPVLNFENALKAALTVDPPLGHFRGSSLNLETSGPLNAVVQTRIFRFRRYGWLGAHE
jgi:hypothetical protein